MGASTGRSVTSAALESIGRNIDPTWRCNRSAVDAGNLELTYPSAEMIDRYEGRNDTLVVRSGDGFGVFVEDHTRGGGHTKWLVVPEDGFEAMASEIVTAAIERFGFVWGRVTNPQVRERLIGLGCRVIDDDDPELLIAERLHG